MEVVQVDEEGRLLLSSDIDDWAELERRAVSVIVDLDHTLDAVPSDPDRFLYIYYPFEDRTLPDLEKLHAVARMAAALTAHERVLVHCRMGYNRSALVVGIALTYLGWSGAEALSHLRSIRPGALFNEVFADYLEVLPAIEVRREVD
ncbi:MAG: dual specificity protein phosphatase [Candidatus Eisenbacteria bacterium]